MNHLKNLVDQITVLILDVDGILTNGQVWFDHQGHSYKAFHTLDGLGMKRFQEQGYTLAVISGHACPTVRTRLEKLGVQHIYLGFEDKRQCYETIKDNLNVQNYNIAYMGDDLPDLPLMEQAGLALTVPNAVDEVKQISNWISTRSGGSGAVREAIDHILKTKKVEQKQILQKKHWYTNFKES